MPEDIAGDEPGGQAFTGEAVYLKKRVLDEDVLTMARRRVSEAFDRFDIVSVSFSGGKDSTVVLNLAYEEAARRGKLPLDVFCFDEEAIHPPTVEYIRRVSRRPGISFRWLCLPVEHRNACSREQPYWHPWDPADQHLWVRELPAEAITQLPGFNGEPIPATMGLLFRGELGTVGILMGIRADESLRRRRIVSRRETDNWISPYEQHRTVPANRRVVAWQQGYISLCKPIYDWASTDVWRATREHGWDYNQTYDIYALAGIPLPQQRVCPPYGEEPLGNLWTYAVCFPELWERMLYRVKGAAAAGRYAKGPLYGFADRLRRPPEGLTWKEAIQAALLQWPEAVAAKVAARIEEEIVRHNRRTNNRAIPDYADLGLSMSFLYMIAVRGDFKARRRVKYPGGDIKVRM